MIYQRYQLRDSVKWDNRNLDDYRARRSYEVSNSAARFIDRIVASGSTSPDCYEEHEIAHELNEFGLLNPSYADYHAILILPPNLAIIEIFNLLVVQIKRDIGQGMAPAKRTNAGFRGIAIASLRANRLITIAGLSFSAIVFIATSSAPGIEAGGSLYTTSAIPTMLMSLLLSVITHEYSHYLAIRAVRGEAICTMQIGPRIRIVHFSLSSGRRRLVGLCGPIGGALLAIACLVVLLSFSSNLLPTVWMVALAIYHLLFLLPFAADGKMLLGRSEHQEWPQ